METKDISEAYSKAISMIKIPDKALKDLFALVDRDVINRMAKDGYSYNAILTVMRESTYFSTLPVEKQPEFVASSAAQDLENKELEDKDPKETYKNYVKYASDYFVQFFHAYDKSIVISLLHQGFDILTIQKAFLMQNFYCRFITDLRHVQDYCDMVFNSINKEINIRSENVMKMIERSYNSEVLAIKGKYTNAIYSVYDEAEIIINLLRVYNYPFDAVASFLKLHSNLCDKDKAFLSMIIQQCKEIENRYNAIDNCSLLPPSKKDTPQWMYQTSAHKYMVGLGKRVLNSHDELNIVNMMALAGFDEAQITEAFSMCSPIAVESGRVSSEYIKSLIDRIKEKKRRSEEHLFFTLEETKKAYHEFLNSQMIKRKKALFNEWLNNNANLEFFSGIHFDCLAVRNLLKHRHLLENIKRALIEESQYSAIFTEKISPIAYAKWIVGLAQKSLENERKIKAMNISDIPKGKYKDLLAQGITAAMLYGFSVCQRIALNPSYGGKLLNFNVDIDAAENLLVTYPDIDRKDLEAALRETSPFCVLPGLPKDYSLYVKRKAEERIAQAEKERILSEKMANEYQHQCGLAKEGIEHENDGTSMFVYHAGRAAMQLIGIGYSDADIKKSLMDTMASMQLNVSDVEEFMDSILHKSKKSLNRLVWIRDYADRESEIRKEFEQEKERARQNELLLKEAEAKEDYCQSIIDEYEKNKFNDHSEFYVDSSMDVNTYFNLLLSKKYTDQEINDCITKNSPVAVEPGRDDHYCEFCENKAKEKIEQENMLYQKYIVVPRINKEEDPIKEYNYHRETMGNIIHFPYEQHMDEMIAEAMFMQTFPSIAIATALLSSPIAEQSVEYVHDVFEEIGKGNEFEEIRQELDNVVMNDISSGPSLMNEEDELDNNPDKEIVHDEQEPSEDIEPEIDNERSIPTLGLDDEQSEKEPEITEATETAEKDENIEINRTDEQPENELSQENDHESSFMDNFLQNYGTKEDVEELSEEHEINNEQSLDNDQQLELGRKKDVAIDDD